MVTVVGAPLKARDQRMSSGASIFASVRVRVAASQRKPRSVLRRLPPAFLLKGGIFSPALEEVAEGAVEMPQRLLGGTLETSLSQVVSGSRLRAVNAAEVSA